MHGTLHTLSSVGYRFLTCPNYVIHNIWGNVTSWSICANWNPKTRWLHPIYIMLMRIGLACFKFRFLQCHSYSLFAADIR